MTHERLVWVVTDQGSNNEALLACIGHVAQEFGDVGVRHVYVTKYDLVKKKVPLIVSAVRNAQLKWAKARPWDPVLVFRDSECRADRELHAVREHVTAIVGGLRPTFPNTWGLAFNPMLEAAFLLFDEAVAALRANSTDQSVLQRLVDAKRQRHLVNKDLLQDTLGVANHLRKRELDGQMASLLFGETPVACPDRQYTAAIEEIRRVLRAGLQPDQGTNAAGGSAPE